MTGRGQFKRLVVVAGLALFGAASVAAQLPPPPPSPPLPPPPRGELVSTKPLEAGTGLILGRVIEAGTNTPVADAMVTLSGAALGLNGQRFANGCVDQDFDW